MEDLVIKNARVIDGTGQAGFVADVAMTDGVITEVGNIDSAAVRSIEADGRVLTPGFVDIHTHFDGQFCWDKQVTPSCWHGVTTVVAGNCGVGFAPVRPGTEDALVQLMESVEDIPGAALHEGIPWGWESFGEYLDVIDTPYSVDVGTQLAHVAVRHYVMGERCYDDASATDIAEMSAITLKALEAGALGFSTSRFFGHRDKQGELVPGTHASADELIAIGDAFRQAGHGTIEIISDHLDREEELAWIEHILIESGRPVTVLVNAAPAIGLWAMAERLGPEGHQLRPQVGARPPSLLMSLEGTINPMRQFAAYNDIAERPLDEQRRTLRDPAFRARVLAEPLRDATRGASMLISAWSKMYVLPADLSYEPSDADSLAAIAGASGCDVREVLMDALAGGRPILFLFGFYPGDLELQREALIREQSVFGLSDGGAHCGVLCDASVPTYMLAYMSRDRTKGPLLPLEFTVHKMTQDTASVYGMTDRGVIAPGFKADLNLIDLDALHLLDPEMVYDLPAGGKRLIQKARGYDFTINCGQVTYEDGEHTGEMPGRLVRGGRSAL